MKIIFLGTSAMMPTKERNHTAVFIKHQSEGILVDCGEGVQRQFKVFGESPTKITRILISHWHGDHILGMPGLLQTLSAADYATKEKPIEIYGPKDIKNNIAQMLKAFPFDNKLNLKINEVQKETCLKINSLEIRIYPLEHNIPCIGFRIKEVDKIKIDLEKVKSLGIPDGPLLGKLQQNKSINFKGKTISPKETTYVIPGKIVGIITDTSQCKNCLEIAKEADYLICEATFMEKEAEKAENYYHLTIKQAAKIAHMANAKKLILTHFSQRYKDNNDLEQEAKDIFPEVILAYDGLKINI